MLSHIDSAILKELDRQLIKSDVISIVMNKLDNEKQELNELINQSPLNLSIALMKICQENDFKHSNGLKYKSK